MENDGASALNDKFDTYYWSYHTAQRAPGTQNYQSLMERFREFLPDENIIIQQNKDLILSNEEEQKQPEQQLKKLTLEEKKEEDKQNDE